MTRIGDEVGISDMSAERIKRFSAFGNCQSPNSRVAALTSMSLAPPKPKRQSSVDCGRPKGRNQSETKDQQNAQLVVSALDLAVEERRLAEFRTRCLVQEDLIIIIPSPFRTETTQAYFPEAESQRTRQVQRNKLVCYFPDLQISQNRWKPVFAKGSKLNLFCVFKRVG